MFSLGIESRDCSADLAAPAPPRGLRVASGRARTNEPTNNATNDLKFYLLHAPGAPIPRRVGKGGFHPDRGIKKQIRRRFA